jgi:MOSC domain-containing protein YiiM
MKIIGVVNDVLTGRSAPYAKPDISSAINKKSVAGSVKVC